MAYEFKKKKTFNAIERDKANLNPSSSRKTSESNSAFGSANINDMLPVQKIIEKVVEVHENEKVSLELIKPRDINDFDKISSYSLKYSIKRVGLLTPIIVRETDNNKYIIIAGHRRFEAYKELLADAKHDLISAEESGNEESIKAAKENIDKYSAIPCIVFVVKEEGSELLGTDPKYITAAQEEEIYKASNLENRQISAKSLANHIDYFYTMINTNPEYKNDLLKERNKDAKRKATKLNMADTISQILTKELKFSVAPSYVWQVVTLKESTDEFPKYHKIAMDRLKNGERVKTVYNDFVMACKVHNNNFEEQSFKDEYDTRMLKGNEKIVDIYNECFNIKPKEKVATKKINKNEVVNLIKKIYSQNLTEEQALGMLNEIKK